MMAKRLEDLENKQLKTNYPKSKFIPKTIVEGKAQNLSLTKEKITTKKIDSGLNSTKHKWKPEIKIPCSRPMFSPKRISPSPIKPLYQ